MTVKDFNKGAAGFESVYDTSPGGLGIVPAYLAGGASASSTGAGGAAAGAFSVRKSADQTGIVSSVATKVTFDTEDFDVSGWFDTATNSRYLPLTAGYYRFSGQIAAASGDSYADQNRLQVSLYKNGSLYQKVASEHLSGTTDDFVIVWSITVEADGSADYFEVFFDHNNGSNRKLGGGATVGCRFQGELVGIA